jgi:transcriptional regulator with XRE-family HTH domain
MEDIFTQKFNEALKQSGISQTELANKIGVHKQCISDYKSGKSFPSLPTLRLIAVTLEVSSDYLLGLNEL